MRYLLTLSFLLISSPLWAAERWVISFSDSGPGSLREILNRSCMDEGDDTIHFYPTRLDLFRINLQSPLEIPADCNGAITITGSVDKETILDGSGITTGEAILVVSSWGDTIEGLTFVGYQGGAGLVLEDSDNTVEDNFFGIRRTGEVSPNAVGMQVGNDWNILRGNTLSGNTGDGVLLEGDANTLQGNRIGDPEGSCERETFLDQTSGGDPTFVREISNEVFLRMDFVLPRFSLVERRGPCGNGGAGIRIRGSRNLIGGDALEDGNRILFNDNGGIVVESTGQRNRFAKNALSNNRGEGIRLDARANGGIEPLRSLQSFPVESEPANGVFRYTLFGEGTAGTTVDLYLIASNEKDDSVGRGEGAKYLESFAANGGIFTRTLERPDLPPGARISSIVCDANGNCSEFSPNAAFGRDSDHDGILDPIEDPNGDLVIQRGETDPLLIDTDGDGLPDSVEDRNQNGIVDPGETDPRKADTDGDGISDFVETGGDGFYNPEEGDTDPRNIDTDGDGIPDGVEDANHNGVIDLGERDPTDPNL